MRSKKATEARIEREAQAPKRSKPQSASPALPGKGQPLDSETRADMEARFQHDFSQVRVHPDGEAGVSARVLNAAAYTSGNHIVFGQAAYRPATVSGRMLLAHELAHVIQQQTAGPGSVAARPAAEREAGASEGLDANATRTPHTWTAVPAGTVQRYELGQAPVNPEIASLPIGRHIDRYTEVHYDLDYRSVGGNLSRWLRVVYADGTEIDLNIFEDFTEVTLHPLAVRDALAQSRIGVGGRIVPDPLNEQTAPRLWAARQSALEAMDEFNLQFILAATPAVVFIITMPLAAMGSPAGSAVRRPMARRIAPIRSGISGFSAPETAVIRETQRILRSPEMAQIRAAQAAGESVTVRVGGRVIQYEPGLPASGMTMFGENGFLIGREAFATEAELTKTLLHELYRLSTSSIGRGAGATGAAATSETQAAFQFAERAFRAVFQ